MQTGTAWIIGGGSGIGAATARLLAARGWTVAISGRRLDKLAEVASASSRMRCFGLDVSDNQAVIDTVRNVVADLGRIDLFVFSVAVAQPTVVGRYDIDEFTSIMDANYLGLIRVADPLIAQMRLQGGGQFAVVTSLAGYFGVPRAAAYASTKAALISLLQTKRVELAPDNICVRMIAPGYVRSELTDRNDFPMPLLLETDDAARRIVDGLTRSKRFEIAFPRRMVWLMKVVRWLPYPLFFRLMATLLPKPRR